LTKTSFPIPGRVKDPAFLVSDTARAATPYIFREFQKAKRKSMAITKAELVEIVCDKAGFSRHESVEFLEKVFAVMQEALEKGEKTKIIGLGNFVVREKKPRKKRNLKPGLELTITARRVLTFKPSSILRKEVNKEISSPSSLPYLDHPLSRSLDPHL
jgi:integration host factor subunit alpha